MNVSWVHTAGRPCVMACRSQNSWEGFPLSQKWVSGETPLDILKMSHMHCMFGSNMSDMAWIMSVRHVWIQTVSGAWFACETGCVGNHTDRARGLAFFSTTLG